MTPKTAKTTCRSHTGVEHRAVLRWRRCGKVLVLFAILLPTLLGIVGLVIDGGLMMDEHRHLQHATDAAATAAARELGLEKGSSAATGTATNLIQSSNELPDAVVTVNIPPVSGPYAGQDGHVEVIAQRNYQSHFMHVLDGILDRSMQARTVAGVEDVTAGAAIVVLDPDPADVTYPTADEVAADFDEANFADEAASQSGVADILSPVLSSVPLVESGVSDAVNTQLEDVLPDLVTGFLDDVITGLPTTAAPTLTAGLEVEGLGRLIVDGAIHVNNEWGGVDENGDPAGSAAGPPYAVACMPVLSTTTVLARDIRVVGGVDDQNYYLPFDADESNPLQANRLPVDDPFQNLPVPSTASDASNVDPTIHDPADLVRVALPASDATQLIDSALDDAFDALSPLLDLVLQPLVPQVTEKLSDQLTEAVIQPGVYNSITVLSPAGGARFEPGVYIIRGTSPTTNMSLCILGPVEAEGVLFYITDSSGYDPSTGLPDANDDPDVAPPNPLASLQPSVYIVPLLARAKISGLNDAGSPFNGMLIYQRRADRRPIFIEAQQMIGSGDISGTIYAKWAHTIFVGGAGSYNLRFVTGTMRVLTVTDTTIAPTTLFPAAEDVLLLE